MMELILEAMKLIDRISVIGSRIAISDAGVGITMCEADLRGSDRNGTCKNLQHDDQRKQDREKRDIAGSKKTLPFHKNLHRISQREYPWKKCIYAYPEVKPAQSGAFFRA